MDAERVTSREEFMRAYLAGHDEACPVCKYSLRGLESGCCPECGEGLRLHVGSVEPKLTAWIFGLVPLAGATGLFVIALLISTYLFLIRQAERPWAHSIVPLVLVGGALVFWLRGRIWFYRHGRRARYLLAVGALIWTGAVIVGLILLRA